MLYHNQHILHRQTELQMKEACSTKTKLIGFLHTAIDHTSDGWECPSCPTQHSHSALTILSIKPDAPATSVDINVVSSDRKSCIDYICLTKELGGGRSLRVRLVTLWWWAIKESKLPASGASLPVINRPKMSAPKCQNHSGMSILCPTGPIRMASEPTYPPASAHMTNLKIQPENHSGGILCGSFQTQWRPKS